MKKIIAVLLALFVTFSIPIPSFAVSNGTGTKEDPFLIYDSADVMGIKNNLSAYYKFMADIDMSKVEDFVPIGNENTGAFNGTIDGNGKTISNLSINAENEKYGGFVGYNEGTIKNLTFDKISVSGNRYVGGVCGYNANGAVISNCDVIGSVNCSKEVLISLNIGGIVGFNAYNATILDCSSNIDIRYSVNSSSTLFIGGICGRNDSGAKIIGCLSEGYVGCTSKSAKNLYMGGIIGYNSGNVANITNKANVNYGNDVVADTLFNHYVGGLIGRNTYSITLENCNNYGNVTVSGSDDDRYSASTRYTIYTGGIVAYSSEPINYIDVENHGDINCTTVSFSNLTQYVAGISAFSRSSLFNNCNNYGNITADNVLYHCYAGGLAYNTSGSSFYNCNNYGEIYASHSQYTKVSCAVGISNSATKFDSCNNYGYIYGYVGNVFGIGETATTVINCNNYGNSVSGSKYAYPYNHVGIIKNASKVENCNNYGSFTTGVLGLLSGGSVKNCTSKSSLVLIGKVSGTTSYVSNCCVSGYDLIMLYASSSKVTIEDSYALNDTSHSYYPGSKVYSSSIISYNNRTIDIDYEQFDTKVWNIGDKTGFPYLKSSTNEYMINYRGYVLDIDDSIQLKVFKENDVVESDIDWISDNPNVAVVDSSGRVVAKNYGITNIFASFEGNEIGCTINVSNYKRLNDITTTADTTIKYQYSRYDTTFNNIIYIYSSDPSKTSIKYYDSYLGSNIAEYRYAGVKFTKAGIYDLVIICDNGRYTQKVIVTNAATSITIPTETIVARGQKNKLSFSSSPSGNESKFTWSSSDSSIVKVDQNGNITGVSLGTATVTVMSDSGITAKCVVTVNAPVQKIELSKSAYTIVKGSTLELLPTITPIDTTDTITYTVSTSSYISVDSNGVVTANEAGSTNVTIKSSNGITKSCNIIVVDEPIFPDSITLNHSKLSMKKGNTEELIATVTPDVITSEEYTWSSSDDSIVSVDDDGKITAKESGVATITYTHIESGMTATCEVTVEHEHSYSPTVQEPTCEDAGYTLYTCSCGDSYTAEKTKKLGHEYSAEYIIDVDATCTVEGSKSKHCTRNGCTSKTDVTAIPATGHSYGSYETTKSATCTAAGSKQRICSVCNNIETATIIKLGHSYSSSYTVDDNATCTTEGSKSKHCTRTGCIAKTGVTAIAKLAHSNTTVTTKATLSKDGKVVTKCSVCGNISKTTIVYYPKTITLSATSYTYDGKVKTPTVTVKDSKGNTLKKDTDYTVKYSDGRKNTGKYSVTVTFKGKYSGTKTLYFNILPSKTSKITPICATTSIKASWNKVTGASGYKVELLNSKGKVVKSATTTKTAYTFKSLSKVTTYKVRVTAYKTIDSKKVYSSSSTTITTSTAPTKVTLSKVTAGSKSATPTWKKVSGASGYEVMYSTSSKFSSSKTATVNKGSSTKTTIKKLTKGKKYYFKVRAYKTVDGKKVYGAWSAVKSVKVK